VISIKDEYKGDGGKSQKTGYRLQVTVSDIGQFGFGIDCLSGISHLGAQQIFPSIGMTWL